MSASVMPGGRVSARRLAELLGAWRSPNGRQAASELAGGVRLLAREGRLPAGTRLPAERELAGALAVSRTLVTSAMDLLRTDGVVASRRGAGSWIVVPGHTRPGEPVDNRELIDLARASPEAVPAMADAVAAAADRLPVHLRGHGYQPHGLPELRAAIAARFDARGLATAPDQIVVTTGAHHAFGLLLRLFVHPGDRVLVEQPTYPNALDAIRASSALAVGVAMTEHGWSLDGIEAALRQSAPKLAYFVPEFHNPTGHRMTDDDRARLGALLRRTRTTGVADETLFELDLDGDPLAGPAPLAGCAPDQVVTIGSASKSHWGGLRIGWVRAPMDMVNRIIGVRATMDLGAPVFEQLVLAELLADPEPALRQRRAELARRRDLLLAALATHCPQWIARRPAGGLVTWCELDEPVATRLAVAGESYGLRLVPGSRFGVDGGWERWLRVPFTLPPHVLTDAVARLGNLAHAVGGGHAADGGRVPIA